MKHKFEGIKIFFREKINMVVLFLLLFFGVLVGASICSLISNESKQQLYELYTAFTGLNIYGSNYQIFISSLFSTCSIIFCIYLLGYFPLGLPIIYFIVFYKGYTVGYTIAFITSIYSFKGLLISLLCVVPQAMILTYIIIFLANDSIEYSKSLFKTVFLRQNTKIPKFTGYTVKFMIVLLISFTEVIYSSTIAPFFIRIFFR